MLFTAGLVLAQSVMAQGMAPKAVIDARVTRYRELGAAFKSLNDQAKSGTLLKISARPAAKTIVGVARDQYGWFPAGTGQDSGLKTKAKPAIWSNAAGFKQAQAAFQIQADVMAKAVDSGDIAKVQLQVKALGATCAGCHRTFRAD